MDYLRHITMRAEQISDLNLAYEYSQNLYQVIYPKKDKIFSYDAGHGDGGDSGDQNEQNLIDFLVATEIISFSVLSIGLQPNLIDNQQQELLNSIDKLVSKMSGLTLSPNFLDQNKIVSKFVTLRGNGGMIQSIQDLLC